MSDDEKEETIVMTREEERLAFEIYYLIVRTILDKGVVKYGEIRQVYQKTLQNDKSVRFRALDALMTIVNDNLKHWQGWNAVLHEDRLTYVNVSEQEPIDESAPNETERALGVLKNALMYVFVATNPVSKQPGVQHDELMTYLEASISRDPDGKLSQSDLDKLRKQIAPNPRAEFVKKGYLSYCKSVNENDEEVFRYEWGPAALQTVDPTELVQLFQKLSGMPASQLAEQAQRAIEVKEQQLAAVAKKSVVVSKRKTRAVSIS